MLMIEIRRERLVPDVAPLDVVVAEATEVLGYNVPESRATSLSKLRQALAKLEIEPLVEADVVRYQAEQVVELLSSPSYLEEALRGNADYRFFHYWESVDLNRYRDPIPEFVLHKAIQLKKELPEVTFSVQVLQGTPDPFLLAKLGYEDHAYIEVWAEPKFEGRLSR